MLTPWIGRFYKGKYDADQCWSTWWLQMIWAHTYMLSLLENHDVDTMNRKVLLRQAWRRPVNEYMNWNSHVQKIANKISRTLGVMNRLKRYLPISPMKLMYDSLILSHLQFGITNWGFEWDRISKLQKRALRIMTNSGYNAHTEPRGKGYIRCSMYEILV